MNNTIDLLKFDRPEQYPQDEILNDKDRLVRSWASVEVTDKQGDIVPIDEMKRVLNTWFKRGATMIDQHSNRPIGRGLRWMEAEHPETGKPGIIIDYQVFDDYSVDDDVWNDIKTGKRTGLSIGGRATGEPELKMDDYTKEPGKYLHGLELYEISPVDRPANQFGKNIAVNYLAKSDKESSPEDLAKRLMNDLSKGFAVKNASKPFAGFKNMDECVHAQMEKGHSEDSARRIATFLMHQTNNNWAAEAHAKPALAKADKLPGGAGDGLERFDFDVDELNAGIAHELEHTDDPEIAEEIAMDHLAEDPQYYSKLKLIEKCDKAVCKKSVRKDDEFEFVDEGLPAQMLRSAIAAELSAISLYESMALKADDERLSKLFLDVAEEEKVHVGEFQTYLTAIADQTAAEKGSEGAEEMHTIIDSDEKSEEVQKPFAGYKDFDACVAANQDKEDPKAYCATIMRNVEGKSITKDQSLTKRRVYLKPGEQAPSGVKVQQGAKGGRFYDTMGASSSSSKPTTAKKPARIDDISRGAKVTVAPNDAFPELEGKTGTVIGTGAFSASVKFPGDKETYEFHNGELYLGGKDNGSSQQEQSGFSPEEQQNESDNKRIAEMRDTNRKMRDAIEQMNLDSPEGKKLLSLIDENEKQIQEFAGRKGMYGGSASSGFQINNNSMSAPRDISHAMAEAVNGGYDASLNINGESYPVSQGKDGLSVKDTTTGGVLPLNELLQRASKGGYDISAEINGEQYNVQSSKTKNKSWPSTFVKSLLQKKNVKKNANWPVNFVKACEKPTSSNRSGGHLNKSGTGGKRT